MGSAGRGGLDHRLIGGRALADRGTCSGRGRDAFDCLERAASRGCRVSCGAAAEPGHGWASAPAACTPARTLVQAASAAAGCQGRPCHANISRCKHRIWRRHCISYGRDTPQDVAETLHILWRRHGGDTAVFWPGPPGHVGDVDGRGRGSCCPRSHSRLAPFFPPSPLNPHLSLSLSLCPLVRPSDPPISESHGPGRRP